jgi:DNA-binding transcriptional LysR family regulator
MNEKTAPWDDLQHFLAVAREGGLSPAAQHTGRSPATLGRRMLALERQLGRELFLRHERGYDLTAEGRALRDALAPVETGIARATAPRDEVALPLVKVSAGTWTTMVLLEQFARIAGDPVDTMLRFVASEAVLDIPHREVAVGVRNRPPTEPNLAGRKLQQLTFAVYQAAQASQGWIKVQADTPSARWGDRAFSGPPICEVSAPRNALDLACAGVGQVVLPCFIGAAQKGLHQIGPVIAELTHDRWIVTHQDDRHLPEVRRVIDRMCRVLSPNR